MYSRPARCASSIDSQLSAIGYFAAHARCVAVDVHYSGVVHGADHHYLIALTGTAEQRYATVKANVGALKPLSSPTPERSQRGSLTDPTSTRPSTPTP